MPVFDLNQGISQLRLQEPQKPDIKSFYESLSKQQIRELQTLIKNTEFRFDIVAKLPLELVSLIFQNLDLYQCFQCRRVSQKWRQLLSAEELVSLLIQPWTTAEDPLLQLPKGASIDSSLAIKAEHQDAFQNGNLFSSIQIEHGQNLSADVGLFKQAYSHGLLAWVDRRSGSDVVYLHDILTGEERTFTAVEREEVDEIILSRTLLVAMTTTARCYIWAHQTSRPPHSLRCPSRCRNVFHLSDASFVLIQIQPNFAEPLTYERFSVIVWRMQNNWENQPLDVPPQGIVTQFFARFPSGSSVMCWHDVTIDRSLQHVIIFESMVNVDKHTHAFRILHLNLHGNVLFEGSIECPYSTNITWNIHENSLTQKERFFEVWLVAGVKDKDALCQRPFSVQHTAAVHMRYSLDARTLKVLKRISIRHNHALPAGAMMELFPWKGIAFFEEPCWAGTAMPFYNLRVMDFRKGTCATANIRGAPIGTDTPAVMFIGDEVFLAKVTATHFVVWCFDKNIRMAGENGFLRDERLLGGLEPH